MKVDDWGKKKLAYEIQKFNKGHVVLFNYLGNPEGVEEIERTLRIDDSVLRFLTVKLEDRVDIDERVATEEARKLATAAAESAAAEDEAAASSEGAADAATDAEQENAEA